MTFPNKGVNLHNIVTLLYQNEALKQSHQDMKSMIFNICGFLICNLCEVTRKLANSIFFTIKRLTTVKAEFLENKAEFFRNHLRSHSK